MGVCERTWWYPKLSSVYGISSEVRKNNKSDVTFNGNLKAPTERYAY